MSKVEPNVNGKNTSYARANSNKWFEPVALETFPEPLRPALRELDTNDDGKVQPREILRAVVAYQDAKVKNTRLMMAVTLLVALVVVMLLGNFGLTYAVMELAKDIESNNGALTDTSGNVLQTANADTKIVHLELNSSSTTQTSSALIDRATNQLVTVKAEHDETGESRSFPFPPPPSFPSLTLPKDIQLEYNITRSELRRMKSLYFGGGENDIDIQSTVTGWHKNQTWLTIKTVDGNILFPADTTDDVQMSGELALMIGGEEIAEGTTPESRRNLQFSFKRSHFRSIGSWFGRVARDLQRAAEKANAPKWYIVSPGWAFSGTAANIGVCNHYCAVQNLKCSTVASTWNKVSAGAQFVALRSIADSPLRFQVKTESGFQEVIKNGITRRPSDNFDVYGQTGGCRYCQRPDKLRIYAELSYNRWTMLNMGQFQNYLNGKAGPFLMKNSGNKDANTCFMGGAINQTPEQLCRAKSPGFYSPISTEARLYQTYHFCPCIPK